MSLGKSHSAEFDGGRPWVRGRILPREAGKDYTLHDKLKVMFVIVPGTQTELNCRTARGQTELSEFR